MLVNPFSISLQCTKEMASSSDKCANFRQAGGLSEAFARPLLLLALDSSKNPLTKIIYEIFRRKIQKGKEILCNFLKSV